MGRGVARVVDAGRIPYLDAWAWQKQLLEDRIAGRVEDTVIVCEHDPVFTVGRKRDAVRNILDPGDTPVVEVERGGDVTWHGPGQLVAYPIVALEHHDLHRWLHQLEQWMIEVCGDLGLSAGRDPRNTGAWVNGRKLGHVGIACRRWVTWHGLSLNVDPDLGWFRRINPCGLESEVETSIARELGRPVALAEARDALIRRLESNPGSALGAG